METQTEGLIFIIVASVCMLTLMVIVVVNLFLRFKNRQLNHRYEILALNERYHSEITKAKFEATELVFKNVAMELHDNICQILTSVVVQLNRTLKKKEFDDVKAIQIRDAINHTIEEIRSISHTLNEDYLKNFDLSTTLEKIAIQLKKMGYLQFNLAVDPNISFKSKDAEIIVLRSLQELINNSIKYSGASQLDLEIRNQSDGVRIIYSDSGKGFDNSKIQNGMGLISIKQRFDMLKADWKIKTAIGEGFQFEAFIPTSNL